MLHRYLLKSKFFEIRDSSLDQNEIDLSELYELLIDEGIFIFSLGQEQSFATPMLESAFSAPCVTSFRSDKIAREQQTP